MERWKKSIKDKVLPTEKGSTSAFGMWLNVKLYFKYNEIKFSCTQEKDMGIKQR